MQTKGRAKFTCARFFVCIMASPPQAGEMPRSGISEGTRYVGEGFTFAARSRRCREAESRRGRDMCVGGSFFREAESRRGRKKSFTDFRLGDRRKSAGTNDVEMIPRYGFTGESCHAGLSAFITRILSFACHARCKTLERGSSCIYARMEKRGESCTRAFSCRLPATTKEVAATSRNGKTL